MVFTKILSPIRVMHIPQLGMKPFYVEVANEKEAYRLYNALADHHLHLLKIGLISDYSNLLAVQVFNLEEQEWEDFSSNLGQDWEEFSNEFGWLLAV